MSKYLVAGLRCDGDYLDNGFNSLAHAFSSGNYGYKGQYDKGKIGRPQGYKVPGSSYVSRKWVNGKWQYVYSGQNKSPKVSEEYRQEKAYNSQKNNYFGRSSSTPGSSAPSSIQSKRITAKPSTISSPKVSKEYDEEQAYNSRKNDYFGLGSNPGTVTYNPATGQTVPVNQQNANDQTQNVLDRVGGVAQNVWNGVSGAAQNVGRGIANTAGRVNDALANGAYRYGDWVEDRFQDLGALLGLTQPDSRAYKEMQTIADPNSRLVKIGYFPSAIDDEYLRNNARRDLERTDRINEFRNNVGNTAQNAWNSATDWLGDRGEDIRNTAQNAGNWLENARNNVGDTVQNAWNSATDWLGDRGEDIRNTAQNAWNSATDWLGDRGEDIRALAGGFSDAQRNDLISRISRGDQEAMSDLRRLNRVNDFRNGVGNAAQIIGNTVSGSASGLRNDVRNTVSGAISGLSQGFQNARNGYGSEANGGFLSNGLNTIDSSISNGSYGSRIRKMGNRDLLNEYRLIAQQVTPLINSGRNISDPQLGALLNAQQLLTNELRKRGINNLR